MLESFLLILQKIGVFIKKHWLLLGVLIFGGILLYTVLNYSLLVISVTGLEANDKATTRSTLTNKGLRIGYNLAPKGDAQISVQTDTKQSLLSTTVSLFKINRVNLELKKQKSVDMLLYDTRGSSCAFGQTIAYECRSNRIYAENSGQNFAKTVVLPELYLLGRQVNYRDGIISIAAVGPSANPSLQLVFTDGKTLTPIDTRQSVYSNYLDKSIEVAPDGTSIIVHDTKQKSVIFYSDARDTTPAQYRYANDFEPSTTPPMVSAIKDGFLIASTTSKDIVNQDSQEDAETISQTRAVSYHTSGSGIEKNIVMDVSKTVGTSEPFDSIVMHTGRTVLVKDTADKLYVIDIGGGSSQVFYKIENVSDLIQIGGQVFYRQGSKIFSLEPAKQTAYLEVDAGGYTLTGMEAAGDSVIFTAISDNTPSLNSVYKIMPAAKEGVEPFNLIPLKPAELPVVSSRFNNGKIYISVDLDSLYRDEDLRPIYKESEYKANQKKILDWLKERGLDTKRYPISFYPGPVPVANTTLFSDDFTGDGQQP